MIWLNAFSPLAHFLSAFYAKKKTKIWRETFFYHFPRTDPMEFPHSAWVEKLFYIRQSLQFSFWGLTWHVFVLDRETTKQTLVFEKNSSWLVSKGRILLLFIRWENLSLIIRIRTNMKFVFWVFWLISHSTLKRWSKTCTTNRSEFY